MSMLGNLLGIQNSMMGFNPQQAVMQFLNQNPMLRQNPQKAKELVLEKFKNGNISRDEFEKFSYMAKQFGVKDDVLSELNQYVK